MAVRLNLTVSNVNSLIGLGYTHIKIFRSPNEITGFIEITTSSTRIPLQTGITSYSFLDKSGTITFWYTTTFFDTNGVATETTMISPFQGEFYDTSFSPITYPAEFSIINEDRAALERVRQLIGDKKEVIRDYVSSLTGYESISADGYTHNLINPRGWPLRVVLDSIEYTTLANPVVNDYQFVTFSGVQISTASGVLDIWYHHFRYSDSELLQAYHSVASPECLDEGDITMELRAILAAIDLLAGELRLFNINSATEIEIFQEIRVNPKGGSDSRMADLGNLMKTRDALIDDILNCGTASDDILGVLID